MFDFHMHSRVSFDGRDTGRNMALAARNGGLREICFTDHFDLHRDRKVQNEIFDVAKYGEIYDKFAEKENLRVQMRGQACAAGGIVGVTLGNYDVTELQYVNEDLGFAMLGHDR